MWTTEQKYRAIRFALLLAALAVAITAGDIYLRVVQS